MKLADSVSGGGFRPDAKLYRPLADSSQRRRGEWLVWTGAMVSGLSAASYGLWFLYRLLDSVFAPALVPIPTGLVAAAAAGAIIGVAVAALGVIMIRRADSLSAAAESVSADDHGLAA